MLLVDQLDDKALLSRLLQAMSEELPAPKKKTNHLKVSFSFVIII